MTNLKKNVIYSSILTTANYVFPLLTYPYVSRVLGVDKIGICNFIDSIINYFILFSMMGISIVGIREIANTKNDKEKLNRTFSSLFIINSISTTIVLVVLVFSILFVPTLFKHRELMFFGVLKLIFNYLNVEWLYKGLEDFKYITIRSILVKCLYIISVFIFIHESKDYVIYYALMCGTYIINGIINISYSKHFVKLTKEALSLHPYIKPFFTLGLYTFLTSMYTSFNVAYLGFTSGETEVGYYTTATKLYSILLALFTAFTGVMLPRMSSLISEKKFDEFKHNLKKSVDILFAFALPLIFFSTVFAPQIINIISGKGYDGAIIPMRIVMPLMLIIGYEQIIIIQTLMPLKEDKIILRNSIIGACIGLLMNILLVGVYKMQSIGSAIVWITSELVILVSTQIFLSQHYNIHFPFKSLLIGFVSHLPLLVFFIFSYAYVNISVLLLVIILTFIYCVILQIFILKNETIVNTYKKYLLPYIHKCTFYGKKR